jgi:hypothetical protein
VSEEPAPAAAPHAIPRIPARRLTGASFEALLATSRQMRVASFVFGLVTLGFLGPLVLAVWAVETAAVPGDLSAPAAAAVDGIDAAVSGLSLLAVVGIAIVAVESRAVAAALLGGYVAGRPVDVRAALQRSRMVFWKVVAATLLAGLIVALVTNVLYAVVAPHDLIGDVSFAITTLLGVIASSPFEFALSGVVLGDVGPAEALRRSIGIFRVAAPAALLSALVEALAIWLVLLGFGSGLDIVLRVADALGVGPGSGTAGLVAATVGLVVLVFAFGTLLYAVISIAVAPGALAFVSLTHATYGLDAVRPGGWNDPATSGGTSGRLRFHWISIPMLVTFVLAALVTLSVAVGLTRL